MDDEFWEHLLRKGAELIDDGDLADAIQTLEQVAGSGHPDAAPKAATLLGQLVSDRGDTESARSLFEYAVGSEHPVAAPKAAIYLGQLRYAEQDVLAAQAAYAIAALSDVVGVSTTAKVAIEQMHDEFEQRMATLPAGHADFERGRRFRTIDEPANAKAAFRRSIMSEDAEYVPRSAIALAMLLSEEQARAESPDRSEPDATTRDAGSGQAARDGSSGGEDDSDEADTDEQVRALLRHAATFRHPEQSPLAAAMLADLLLDDNDAQGAVEMWEIAVTADDPGLANPATAKLAELLVTLERYPEAVERFLALTRSASTETGAHAALRIGILFENLTLDRATAVSALRYAADHATEEIADEARHLLDQIAQRSGEPMRTEPVTLAEMQDATIEALARVAAESAETDNGVPVLEQADPAELRSWAAAAPEDELEAFCDRTMSAGYRLHENDELLAALQAWEQVMATGHRTWSPRAAARIAVGLWTPKGNDTAIPRSACSAVHRLAELGHPHLISRAWLVYAKRMVMGVLFDQAEQALRLASEGDARYAAECALHVLKDERDAIMPALHRIGEDQELVHEVLDFADELAEVRKRVSAETFRTVQAMATFTGNHGFAERAESRHAALIDQQG